MQNSDPRDQFFYPALTLKIDSYIIWAGTLDFLTFSSNQCSDKSTLNSLPCSNTQSLGVDED